MEPARDVLAQLLQTLSADSHLHQTRLEAAALANRLALFHGDPSLTDVAQALFIDAPADCPAPTVALLSREEAVARATRRAIAQAHQTGLQSPRELVTTLVDDPSQVADQARARINQGDVSVAEVILDVGESRHPRDPALIAARVELLAVKGEVDKASDLADRLAADGHTSARTWIDNQPSGMR